MRVLVVEDDDAIRESLQLLLADRGHDVVTAENGLRGLELAQLARPDLVLLDLMMPVMSGWEFLDRFVCSSAGRVPVVVMTAAHPAHVPRATAVLGKPFDLDRLLVVIEQFGHDHHP